MYGSSGIFHSEHAILPSTGEEADWMVIHCGLLVVVYHYLMPATPDGIVVPCLCVMSDSDHFLLFGIDVCERDVTCAVVCYCCTLCVCVCV